MPGRCRVLEPAAGLVAECGVCSCDGAAAHHSVPVHAAIEEDLTPFDGIGEAVQVLLCRRILPDLLFVCAVQRLPPGYLISRDANALHAVRSVSPSVWHLLLCRMKYTTAAATAAQCNGESTSFSGIVAFSLNRRQTVPLFPCSQPAERRPAPFPAAQQRKNCGRPRKKLHKSSKMCYDGTTASGKSPPGT